MNIKKLLFVLFASATYCYSNAQPADLQKTIEQQDSIFFNAYNNCNMELQAAYFSDSIEFFHDRTGLETSKANILASTKKYICGKVTRKLVPGSIEVSPLPGYGAVELGMHQFSNNQEPNSISKPSKFVIVWKQEADKWKITKVISLH